jgi:hypothetical protein
MSDDDAWKWLALGIVLVLVGLTFLRLGDPLFFTMWGVALTLSGGTVALVGTGVLLRLWR